MSVIFNYNQHCNHS